MNTWREAVPVKWPVITPQRISCWFFLEGNPQFVSLLTLTWSHVWNRLLVSVCHPPPVQVKRSQRCREETQGNPPPSTPTSPRPLTLSGKCLYITDSYGFIVVSLPALSGCTHTEHANMNMHVCNYAICVRAAEAVGHGRNTHSDVHKSYWQITQRK